MWAREITIGCDVRHVACEGWGNRFEGVSFWEGLFGVEGRGDFEKIEGC